MKPTPPEDPLRPHIYDGIVEYDKRLPNWWLYTLYATIAFSVAYWIAFEQFRVVTEGPARVEQELAAIETAKLAAAAAHQLDDAGLWQMSRNEAFVSAGRAAYVTNCAACHLPSLRGKSESPVAIGPDLTDAEWIHGGTPLAVHHTIAQGVLAKGMPAWEGVLGTKKVTEIVAFILSHHEAPATVVAK